MTKVKIEDLKVFPTVASAIGKARAKAELFKLQGVKCSFKDDISITAAFRWEDTPQGSNFWSLISVGENPYDK